MTLAVEQEPLDVRRQLGMGLIPPSAGHLHELEPVPGLVVDLGQTATQFIDESGRLLE